MKESLSSLLLNVEAELPRCGDKSELSTETSYCLVEFRYLPKIPGFWFILLKKRKPAPLLGQSMAKVKVEI